MRYIYDFGGYTDTLVRKTLKRNDFKRVVDDIRGINENYGYNIFLVGSYLDYLIDPTNFYNDIDFVITANKIIDLDVLDQFFQKFHNLCKTNNIAYDLMYLVDAGIEDLNTNPKIPAVLGIEESRIITAYRSKHPKNLTPKQFIQMTPHPGTNLFEGLLITKIGVNSIIRKTQTKETFPLPIKIA